MALHHLGAALLALTAQLSILQASDTFLIPVDQLTVEQAYLEWFWIDKQLRDDIAPGTSKQTVIYDRLSPDSLWHHLKPNDRLPRTLRQLMTEFRQEFTHWGEPMKPGTANYQITRGFGLYLLYDHMLRAVGDALKWGGDAIQQDGDLEAQAWNALDTLWTVTLELSHKYENVKGKSIKSRDLKRLEKAIKMAHDAVMALPKFDENGELIPGSSSKLMITSGGDPVGSPSNRLFHLLKQPYVWGPMVFLALGVGYLLLKGHPASSSFGDDYSMFPSRIPIDSASDVATVVSEGSSHLWYILLIGGLIVALIVLAYWWFCIKTGGEAAPEDEAKTASKISKRASKKKKNRRLLATKSSHSST